MTDDGAAVRIPQTKVASVYAREYLAHELGAGGDGEVKGGIGVPEDIDAEGHPDVVYKARRLCGPWQRQ